MLSPAEHVAGHLASLALGALADQGEWGIFVGTEPTRPDSSITIYDTGGTQVVVPLEDPTIQVRIRSHSYTDAYAKAHAIRNALLVPTARILDGWLYTGFWLISDIAKIGRDDNNRELLTINFRLMRQPAA